MTDRKAPVDQDRAAVHFPPPLVFVAALLAGWAVEAWLWPARLGRWLSHAVSIPVGAGLVVAGLLLAAIAIGLFRRSGQQPEPWTPTPELITQGIYRYSRNPMYLAMTLIQLGIGVAVLNPWMILLVPAALWLVYLIAVRHEEAYLERKFGDPYRQYKASVRRWM